MSHSRIYDERFHRHNLRRKVVAVIYVILTLAYLTWRLTVLNGEAITLSLVYYLAEIIGFVLAATLIFCSWNYRHRNPSPAPRGMKVDVFIPAYREALELVRWTVIAAQRISYPHRTILLDDGNRADLKALASELGVQYLARERNINAKAGNLNHGLAHSGADFVMVLDADHIALPHALDSMLGFFRDKRVAMVQTPQDYYNTDAFQYMNSRNGGLWHDQSFFYGVAQGCRDSLNGASCVGTGVVYRRAALDSIGGIPTDTVTEDFHTSLKLHKAGYEVVYLNEPVAYGVAAADIRDYYKTRHRWAHGNIHALRAERILTCKGLSLGQRLSYLTLGLIYLEGWQQVLLFAIPLVSLLMGWPPFDITIFNVLIIFLFPLLATLLLQELGCGLSRYWVNEIFAVARFPTHVVASLALFTNKMRFRTSTKNIHGRVEWQLLSPQLTISTISLAALTVGIVRLALNFKIGPLAQDFLNIAHGDIGAISWNQRLDHGFTLELVVVAGFWAIFNAAKCLFLVRKAVRDARQSSADYRFNVRLPMEIETDSGPVWVKVDRMSQSWFSAYWYTDGVPEVGKRLRGRLYLPSGVHPIECMVTRRQCPVYWNFKLGPIAFEISQSQKVRRIDCELLHLNAQQRGRVAECLYSVDWHREFLHRHAYFATPLDSLGRLVLRRREAEQKLIWNPALYRVAETGQLACAVVGIEAGNENAIVITFHPVPAARKVALYILGNGEVLTPLANFIRPEPRRSLGEKGLDGAVPQKYRVILSNAPPEPVQSLLIAAE
jgi:cellulose synthase/poly-beta-1,6-N-acetylglucosamine synthase-like glycosyltransferase